MLTIFNNLVKEEDEKDKNIKIANRPLTRPSVIPPKVNMPNVERFQTFFQSSRLQNLIDNYAVVNTLKVDAKVDPFYIERVMQNISPPINGITGATGNSDKDTRAKIFDEISKKTVSVKLHDVKGFTHKGLDINPNSINLSKNTPYYIEIIRSLKDNKLQWMISGGALLFASFIKPEHLDKLIEPFLENDEIRNQFIKVFNLQLGRLPWTLFSIIGDKTMSVDQQFNNIVAAISMPIITDLFLLSSMKTMVGITVGAALFTYGAKYLDTSSTLMRDMESMGAIATSMASVGLISNSTITFIKLITGTDTSSLAESALDPGSLSFYFSSLLMSQATYGLLNSATNGYIKNINVRGSLLKLSLDYLDDNWLFAKFKSKVKKKINTLNNYFKTIILPKFNVIIPKQLQFISPTFIFSFAVAYSFWFTQITFPVIVTDLQAAIGWPHNNIYKFMKNFGILDTNVYLNYAQNLVKTIWVQEFYHPFMTMMLQDYFQVNKKFKSH